MGIAASSESARRIFVATSNILCVPLRNFRCDRGATFRKDSAFHVLPSRGGRAARPRTPVLPASFAFVRVLCAMRNTMCLLDAHAPPRTWGQEPTQGFPVAPFPPGLGGALIPAPL